MTATEAANPEGALFCRYILSSLDRLMTCLDGLDERQMNWRPPADNANSVYALATHTLGNAEENILGTLCGQPIRREREQEFLAHATSTAALHERWQRLRDQLQTALTGLSAQDLEREVSHPRRGVVTGRDVLIIVARHAAEHLGQSELTRDLARTLQP
jgi:hypothetical protein